MLSSRIRWALSASFLFACGDDSSETSMDAGRDASVPALDAALDGSALDAAAPDAALDCSAPADGVLPRDLRCTGLYASGNQLAAGLVEYTPAYVLWSDGAEKRRFISVPQGKKIDVSDPDAFVFPVGTKVWKEFSVRGTDGTPRLAETRLLQKSAEGWLYTSYVWNAEQTLALQMDNTNGLPNQNVGGTAHVVPTRDQCNECHGGRGDAILGFDAIMLGAGAVGTAQLAAWIDGALPAVTIPGNAVEQAALGYLHANCGISCHNDTPNAKARDSGLFMRLEKGELTSVQTTDVYRTGLNKAPSPNAKLDGLPNILPKTWVAIRPGDSATSLLVERQKIRGFESQMPRIGTTLVDQDGVAKTAAWIDAMAQ